ncbi:MAG TPA: RDD family protein [Mycobacterium sp.]|nr:RDD family protein [Mycobacterium sp.]
MTAVAEETETTPAVQEASPNSLAPWHFRAGAFAVDLLPGIVVVATMALVALTLPLRSTWWWVCVSVGGLAILLFAVNRLLLPTISGWSLGRAVSGITVVRRDGAAVGPWRLLLRDLAHLLDTVSVLVGWLWPLWDSRRRTFADLLLRTEVRRVQPDRRPHNIRRLTGAAVLMAALLCAGGAAMGYVLVYRHDRALDQARAQIAAQGPKIVEQMLTYDPKTLQGDFEHARSLVTDRYREQLATQQQAVQKARPVTNEYWVTNSSIQSATTDHATMLLFMQGQRGAPPDERYISATVRVTFARGTDRHWRVDDLTVLTKPTPAGNGK